MFARISPGGKKNQTTLILMTSTFAGEGQGAAMQSP